MMVMVTARAALLWLLLADRNYALAASAALTRAGVSGAWRTRAPVASKMALAIAPAVGRLEGSPAPPAGKSG